MEKDGKEIGRMTRFDELPEWLSLYEFRTILGLSRTTAYELVNQNRIKYKKFGRRIFIPREVLRNEG